MVTNPIQKQKRNSLLGGLAIGLIIGLVLCGVLYLFLTSKAGIGYLILYGSQVFNLDLVMTGVFLLTIISIVMYKVISKNTEK